MWLVDAVAKPSDLGRDKVQRCCCGRPVTATARQENKANKLGCHPSHSQHPRPLILPELAAGTQRSCRSVSGYRAHYLQPWKVEKKKHFPLSDSTLQLIPVMGWRYRGKAAEVWQSPLVGVQSHKCTSWALPLHLAPTNCGYTAHIIWLQGIALGFHRLGTPSPTALPHRGSPLRQGNLITKMPTSPWNTGYFPQPYRDLRG